MKLTENLDLFGLPLVEEMIRLNHDQMDAYFHKHGSGQTYSRGYGKPGHTHMGLPHGSYELKRIPLDKINPDNHENPAGNIDPVGDTGNEKHAHKYAKLKTKAPAIIVVPHPTKPGYYKTLDGVHRARAAFLRGDKEIDAYVHSPDSIEEGAKGDWKSEGYDVHATGPVDFEGADDGEAEAFMQEHPELRPWDFSATAPNGEDAGDCRAGLTKDKQHVYIWDVNIPAKHQRKGIATEFYRLAEKQFGKKLLPGVSGLSDDSRALWSQPGRPFGEGSNGDWKKEGIILSYKPWKNYDHSPHALNYYYVFAHTKEGKQVGYVEISVVDGIGIPHGTNVAPAYRRKGIASAMYKFFQEKTGYKLRPDDEQSDDAKSLWAQPDRDFGEAKKVYSAQEVVDHHLKYTTNGIQDHVREIILSHPKWIKTRIPLGDIEERHTMSDMVDRYSAKKTNPPAVILVKQPRRSEWENLDGAHRVAAAIANDETDIEAFVPQDSIEEGANGDWKREGYKIKSDAEPEDVGRGEDWIVYAVDKSGKEVGQLRVYDLGSKITSSDVRVDKDHQRKGLASAMYQYAEKKTGKRMVPASDVSDDEDNMTGDAKKLWDQPRRKFGEAVDGISFKTKYDKGILGFDDSKKFISISALHDGKVVGHAHMLITPEGLRSKSTNVDEEFRRKGIASEMYRLASEKTGLKVLPDHHQSADAKKLWSKRDKVGEMEGSFNPLGDKNPVQSFDANVKALIGQKPAKFGEADDWDAKVKAKAQENRQKVFDLVKAVFPEAKYEGVQISLGPILFKPIEERNYEPEKRNAIGIQISSFYAWTRNAKVMIQDDGTIDENKLREKVADIQETIKVSLDKWNKNEEMSGTFDPLGEA